MSKFTKIAACFVALMLPASQTLAAVAPAGPVGPGQAPAAAAPGGPPAAAAPAGPPQASPEQAAALLRGLNVPFAIGGAAALPGPPTKTGSTIGLTQARIQTPSPGEWPTYSGDYSGQRYSPLNQINQSNVGQLKVAWDVALPTGAHPTSQIGGDRRGVPANPAMNGRIGGSPLMIDGVIYGSSPDNVWAIDARTGAVKWHFHWKTRGGTHIGNRGVGIWGDFLFVETPDNYLVSLDRHNGRERWHVEIAPLEEFYFSTTAPVVIKNHVIVGTGNDAEQAGRLQSFDPVTGERQWIFNTVPMNIGDPGLETWKNLDYARHGGGQPWVPGSYDPETNLYIFGTSEPKPAYFAKPRANASGNSEALFTAAQVALDVDTGKMKWYYQTSPSENHDWDSAQTPILADIQFRGRLRKVMMTASRNGYFFVVDRVTGQHLLTTKFSENSNWASGLNSRGQPVSIPAKEHLPSGALVSAPNPGATNWPPPAYSPVTGLFYVNVNEAYAMYYTADADPRGNMGLGGKTEMGVAGGRGYLKAIDPRTGRIAWQIAYPSVSPTGGGASINIGLLNTAGRLLFAYAPGGAGLVARDPATGRPLWRTTESTGGNAPSTYMVDGKQYLLMTGGNGLLTMTL